MHGVGEWLYLCPAQDCSRGVPGQGFPRHWNLVDHMKRVHNCSPKTHNSDPLTRCTMECNGATPKTSRRKKVSNASASVERDPKSPPIDPAVIGPQGQVRQLRSESPQSVASSTRTHSPLQMMDDAPTHSPTDQSARESIEQLPLEIYGHPTQPSVQTISDSAAQAGRPDQNTAVKEDSTVPQLLKSPPQAIVPVDIPNVERELHPGFPKSNAPESELPAKKPPRCTRSKSGCWTCRKRKIKVGLLPLPTITAADS
jgi:hypothetical protein